MSKIFLLLTPLNASMGDQAITYAEEIYLRKRYPHSDLFILNEEETLMHINSIVSSLSYKDKVFLQGGGNMGSLYPEVEKNRQTVLNRLSSHPVTIFPQSIFLEYSNEEKQCINNMIHAYSKKNVTIYSRERVSYEIMCSHFNNASILLKPDIVYSICEKYCNRQYYRKCIRICIRNDKESNITNREKLRNQVKEYCANVGIPTKELIMFENKCISHHERKAFVQAAINSVGNSKAIITDRLHGCIFSAITKTPCVILPNSYHKLAGNYEWLKEVNYIEFIDEPNIEKIVFALKKVMSIKENDKTQLDIKKWGY